MKIDQAHYRPWQVLCLEWNTNPFLGWCFMDLKSCQHKHKHWATGNVSWHCGMALVWKPNCLQRKFEAVHLPLCVLKNVWFHWDIWLISLHFSASLLLGRIRDIYYDEDQVKHIQSIFCSIMILNINLNVLIIYNWANSRDWTKICRDRQ